MPKMQFRFAVGMTILANVAMAILVFLGVVMVLLAEDGLARVIGVALTGLALAGLGVFYIRLQAYGFSKPLVIVDEDGVMDHRAFNEVIPWAWIEGYDVTATRVNSFSTIHAVHLHVRNEANLRAIAKPQRRWTSGGDIGDLAAIQMTGLEGSVKDLAAAIDAMRHKWDGTVEG